MTEGWIAIGFAIVTLAVVAALGNLVLYFFYERDEDE
jgi:uncharacterized membrane protein